MLNFKHFWHNIKYLKIFWENSHFPCLQFPLFKYIFGHSIYIYQPIFETFAAYFTTNLDLDIDKKYFASCQIDKNIPRKFILGNQF